MQVSIVLVTPEMAEMWLKLNGGNRRLRMWWAEAMAAAMRRGEWIATHQGVAFAASGRLIDGQHRLWAIVKSGLAQQMLVVHDVPDEAFAVLDIGVKRSIADTTGLSKKTAEACRYAGSILYSGNVTPQQVTMIANGGLGEVHERLMEACNTSVTLYTSAPMRVAACLQVMDGHREDYIFDLYRKLALRHFEELPPIGYAFVRQASTGKLAGQKNDIFCRAMKLFHPDYQSISKIQIGEGDGAAANVMARIILQRSIQPDDPPTKQHKRPAQAVQTLP